MTQTRLPQEGSVRPRRRDNHRATIRYRCAPAMMGRLYVGEDQEFQHAWLVNLSQSGVGFYLARPIPVGLAVVIQMRAPVTNAAHQVVARVIHCTQQPQDDWVVGCEFEQPLSLELLDQLL